MKHSPAWRISVQQVTSLTGQHAHNDFFVLVCERKAKFTRSLPVPCCGHLHLQPETAAACKDALARAEELTGFGGEEVAIDRLRSAYPTREFYLGEERNPEQTLIRTF